MDEPRESGAGGNSNTSGGGGGESSRALPKLVTAGDRQLLTVELRPGETTYVSWRKLMKDAKKVNGSSASVPEPPPLNAHPNLESRLGSAPAHPAEKEMKDPPNRFSAVIEKIERLYMGKDSSDEEELDSSPDDDEYDTEDSFIDDAELDEYFEVDNSAIKHDGFFVNRGKLERITEPPTIPNQQPKKRQRKDTAKTQGDVVDVSNKQAKVPKPSGGKTAPSLVDCPNPSQSLSMTREYVNVKAQYQSNATGLSSKKKYGDAYKVSSAGASLPIDDVKHTGKTKAEGLQSRGVMGNKLKEAGGPSDVMHHKYSEKSSCPQSKALLGKPSNDNVQLEAALRRKERNGVHDLPDANVVGGKYPMQMTKPSHMQKRDGSSMRPKGSVLEKAIRELEKVVAESRPPAAMENQEADTSSQAVKRRLPREVKLKLAKVARIAASQGKVSKELINRLMGIVGHLIQLRSLKRNLKVMINMSMSANKEKDDRFQQIKKEVIEMIKTRVPSMGSQAFQQQVGSSDDFQEVGSGEKGSIKKKFVMDTTMEDKICDLYDLFVDGLDEDAGPQIRKLYVELAELWPNRLMDNHGIKRAICRAKERRRTLYEKEMDQDKIKRKKTLAPRSDECVRADTGPTIQQQHIGEKMPTPMDASTSAPLIRMASPSVHDPGLDRSKHDKLKASSSSSNPAEETKIADTKKAKRKPEPGLEESHLRPEKLPTQTGEERHKSTKQLPVVSQKQNPQLAAPSFNHPS